VPEMKVEIYLATVTNLLLKVPSPSWRGASLNSSPSWRGASLNPLSLLERARVRGSKKGDS